MRFQTVYSLNNLLTGCKSVERVIKNSGLLSSLSSSSFFVRRSVVLSLSFYSWSSVLLRPHDRKEENKRASFFPTSITLSFFFFFPLRRKEAAAASAPGMYERKGGGKNMRGRIKNWIMQKVYCMGERTRRTYRRRRKRRHLVLYRVGILYLIHLCTRGISDAASRFPPWIWQFIISDFPCTVQKGIFVLLLFPENESAEIESWMEAPIVNLRAFNFFSIVERKENGEKSYDSSGVQQSWKKRKR